MSKSLRQIFVSVESEENDITDTTVVVSSDQTIEDEVAEVTEAGIEVIEAEDDVEQLHEIAEGLESIVASLEASIEDGGLDAQAAVFMQHAVNGYTSRVGLEAESIVPSLESFGGASGKAAATTISVESVKATIERIWQAIKNAIAKAIEATKNFFSKLFGGVKKLKERSKALKKEVANLSNKTVDADAKVKVPATNTIRYNSKVEPAEVVKGVNNLVSALNKKELVDGAVAYYDHVSKMLDKGEELAKAGEEKFVAELEKGNDFVSKAIKTVNVGLMSGDATLSSTQTHENGQNTSVAFPSLKKNVTDSIAEGTEIKVPTASELNSLLTAVDALIKAIETKDKTVDAIVAKRNASIKAGEKLAKKAADGKLSGLVGQAKVQAALRAANANAVSTVQQLSSHGFNVARGVLALVDRSVKAYSDKP